MGVKPRHTWSGYQFDPHGRRFQVCRCGVKRVAIQAMHGSWHSEYHLPSGHVLVKNTPPCTPVS